MNCGTIIEIKAVRFTFSLSTLYCVSERVGGTPGQSNESIIHYYNYKSTFSRTYMPVRVTDWQKQSTYDTCTWQSAGYCNFWILCQDLIATLAENWYKSAGGHWYGVFICLSVCVCVYVLNSVAVPQKLSSDLWNQPQSVIETHSVTLRTPSKTCMTTCLAS